MILTDDMKDLIALFERHGVVYAVVGGFAVNYYGYPRLTQDFDVLVEPSSQNSARTLAALADFGFGGVGLDSAFFARGGAVLHLGVEPNRIDIMTGILGATAAEVVGASDRITIDDVSLRLISRRDLIRCKRASKRLKDLADAEELAAMSED